MGTPVLLDHIRFLLEPIQDICICYSSYSFRGRVVIYPRQFVHISWFTKEIWWHDRRAISRNTSKLLEIKKKSKTQEKNWEIKPAIGLHAIDLFWMTIMKAMDVQIFIENNHFVIIVWKWVPKWQKFIASNVYIHLVKPNISSVFSKDDFTIHELDP